MSGWPLHALHEVARVGAGNPAPQNRKLFDDGHHKFFRTADVGRIRTGILTESGDLLNDDGVRGLTLHPAGTVLLPKSGASTFTNHRVIMGCDGYVSSHLATVRAEPAKVEPRYLYYALLRVRAQDIATDTSYPTLSLGQVRDIRIPVPPLPEQKRIVTILDEAFEGITSAAANTQANIANIKAMFAAKLAAYVLRSDSDWTTLPFESAVRTITPHNKIQRKFFKDSGRFPIISQEADFVNGYWDDVADVIKVERPLVLFGDHTQVIKLINFDFVQGADGLKILQPDKSLAPAFLTYLLQAQPIASLGYARHYRLLKQRMLSFPDLNEQERIVAYLDDLADDVEALCDTASNKLTALTALKQSLLHYAFTGQL